MSMAVNQNSDYYNWSNNNYSAWFDHRNSNYSSYGSFQERREQEQKMKAAQDAAGIGAVGAGLLAVKAPIAASVGKIVAGGLANAGFGGLAITALSPALLGGIAIVGLGAIAGLLAPSLLRKTYSLTQASSRTFGRMSGAAVRAMASRNNYNDQSGFKRESYKEPSQRQKNLEERKERFKSIVKDVEQKMKQGQDIRGDLIQLNNLKLPTHSSKKILNDLKQDFFLAKHTKNGKIDLSAAKEDIAKFEKESGGGSLQAKISSSKLQKRFKEHQSEMNFTKDGNVQMASKENNSFAAKFKEFQEKRGEFELKNKKEENEVRKEAGKQSKPLEQVKQDQKIQEAQNER